ncbi:MAG: TIGR03435 family protein [Acidobacteriaceae bacterium]
MKAIALRLAAVLLLALGILPATAQTPDISGNWQGTLQAGNGLRTLLKISKTDTGAWKAALYSIDQGSGSIPVTSLTVDGHTFAFTIKPIDVSYTGTLSPDDKSITGNATQGGQTHVLNLTHVTPENTWAIPEPPRSMPPGAKPKYDVVTVKPSNPNRPGKLFTVRGRQVMTINTTVNDLITFAYSLQTKEIVNAPTWMDDKFDVDGVPDIPGQPNTEQMKMLIADALVQRFGLKFHTEPREMSAYVLTVAKGGPKLTLTNDRPDTPGNFLFGGFGKLHVTNSTMENFCHGMQAAVMDKPVVDQTGLTGRYDFNLNWTPDQSQFGSFGAHIPEPNPNDPNPLPSLYTALQEQLGLKLEVAKTKVDVMVIDHIAKPSAN